MLEDITIILSPIPVSPEANPSPTGVGTSVHTSVNLFQTYILVNEVWFIGTTGGIGICAFYCSFISNQSRGRCKNEINNKCVLFKRVSANTRILKNLLIA